MIYLASDHAGFALKEVVKKYLVEKGEAIEDLGTHSEESTDYAIYAHKLGKKISENPHAKGVAVCGTGIGISMALNRHSGVRAARSMSVEDAELTRRHNDANVLVLSGRQTDSETAKQMVDKFLTTEFEGGRHEARVKNMELK
jgi:ribose 5-phosphate isomerase B